VMQSAHALLANHCTIPERARPAGGCLLFQPEVRSVVMIVRNVLGEVSFIKTSYIPNSNDLCDGWIGNVG